jgi:iron complex transport system substrate-binding protein
MSPLRAACFLAGLLAASPAAAAVSATDDAGRRILLAAPARRIVSLSPHATEMLFAAGAGSRVIAADEYSDFPEAANKLGRIGSAYALDLEAIVALKPDLVVAWKSGNDARQVARLIDLGIPVFFTEPRTADDIARGIGRLGVLAETTDIAAAAARRLEGVIAGLTAAHRNAAPVDVFFEIWSPPVMTVNGRHLIDAIVRACGGRNVFGALPALTPTVSVEAVVGANPQVIIASGMGDARPTFLDDWKAWPQIAAVKGGHVYHVAADLIARPGPRIADGARLVCGAIDRARGAANPSAGNKQP